MNLENLEFDLNQPAEVADSKSEREADKKEFCQLWPGCRQALIIMGTHTKSKFVKHVLRVVVGYGDAAYQHNCKG